MIPTAYTYIYTYICIYLYIYIHHRQCRHSTPCGVSSRSKTTRSWAMSCPSTATQQRCPPRLKKARVSIALTTSRGTHAAPMKRDLHLNEKRPMCLRKETCVHTKRDLFRWYPCGKWILFFFLERRESQSPWRCCALRIQHLWKETYFSMKRGLYLHEKACIFMKRDLCIYEKRPISQWKETYVSMKRDLYLNQKRPISQWKEAHISTKRGLHLYEKRLVYIRQETYSNEIYVESVYRVAKTHRMPHLHRSISAKEPYN